EAEPRHRRIARIVREEEGGPRQGEGWCERRPKFACQPHSVRRYHSVQTVSERKHSPYTAATGRICSSGRLSFIIPDTRATPDIAIPDTQTPDRRAHRLLSRAVLSHPARPLLRAVMLCALVGVGVGIAPGPALAGHKAPTVPCWKRLLNDWYD